MSVAWLFPGQGAQRVGMGAALFDRYPELVRQADEILGYSVRAQVLDGAEPGLTDTRHVQPALFVVNALTFLARREENPDPDFVAGHSLGEYNALFAAGCFDFATGVRLVRHRGELMGRAGGGGMLAVVGADPDRVAALLAEAGLDDVDLANRNSAVQVVISGPTGSLDRAAAVLRGSGVRSVPLRVSAPFHSRYMAEAAERFSGVLAGVRFASPRLPVIANVTARPYPADGVADLLARQVDHPVRWWESMSHLLERGVTEIVEVGPGRVLTELWQAVLRCPCPSAPPEPVSAPAPAGPPDRSPDRSPDRVPAETRTAVRRPSGAVAGGGPAPERLGSAEFRRDYGLRYAYLAGAMYRGIASVDLVVRLARAGLMGFFGAGGLSRDRVEDAIRSIRAQLGPDGRFGMNLLATPDDPAAEREMVELYLRHDVRVIEASAYTGVTPAVVRFRFSGAHRGPGGEPVAPRHVMAKVSRPEVAAAFLSPPPAALLDRLVAEGALTAEESRVAAVLPVATDVCVEADSGGHTDGGSPYALMPAMVRLRDDAMARYRFPRRVRVGAAGGIGSPESAAAAFVLGADFVVTGSVNQCSPQAGTSDAVKDMLAGLDVQDTAYAPAGDMFELGARVQVVRRGTLFPARANKLYQVYRRYDGLHDIDAPTRAAIEERYFRRSFDAVWEETREFLASRRAGDIDRADRHPKVKMALVFRWYFAHSTRAALAGDAAERVNYQIHCGPALGAFNRVVAGTELADWRRRDVDAIAELLMTGAAELLGGTSRRWTD
ncbi:ACP S-malonyltransferase [Sphaerimonospora sp. CA-214678]|uniref:ACP S-malonyltransferase n=1 Tax=Sphaerimonospora sp. CA-214678 TaxID=3240029 RepID=UPI003D8A9890